MILLEFAYAVLVRFQGLSFTLGSTRAEACSDPQKVCNGELSPGATYR